MATAVVNGDPTQRGWRPALSIAQLRARREEQVEARISALESLIAKLARTIGPVARAAKA